MKYLWITIVTSSLLSGCGVDNNTETTKTMPENALSTPMLNVEMSAPVAKKVPYAMDAHGVTRVDNYYWMRDDTRTDEAVLAHLEKENNYVETVLAPLKSTRETLYEELVSRIEKDDSTVPVLDNGFWYYTSYSGENEYPVYLRKPSLDAEPQVLLDANVMSKGHDYFSIDSYAISENNALMAYSVDTLSRRIYTIYVKNIKSDEKLGDVLEGTSGSVVWANNNTHLFYVKKDPQTLLGYQVYRHELGSSQSDDVLVYEETDPTFYTSISKSKDDSVIYILHQNTDKTGVTVIDANNPTAPTREFLPLEDGREYSVAKAKDGYYVLTNIDAKNFRVMKAPLGATDDVSKWEEVIAHRPNVFLQSIELMKNHLVVKEKENGMLRMVVHNLTTKEEQVIPTQDPIYGAYFNANPEMDTNKLRIYYSSLTTPGSIIDINLDTLDSEVMKQTRVSDTFDSSTYASERVMIEARDGAKVPVSLVYRKDKFKKNGTIPLTTGEYTEWGNPANKAEFDYMLSYSPYDQVEAKEYPHMLVTTGLHDSQVQYFEPMKWVAKLREYKTDDNLLLFKTDMEAGHGGASGRFKRFESTALEYAFVLHLAGVPL